jgi:glycosyltransferase involved in cell wall biosynthesis
VFNVGHNRRPSGESKRSLWRRIHGRVHMAWSFLTLPDPRVGWVPNAARAALGIVRRGGITHVYISGSPFSSFLIGCVLKWFADVRVIVDYRDPWTQNITYHRKSRLHTWLDRRLEGYVVKRCDVAIANTRYNNARMVEEFGGGDGLGTKFVTIHNGFDGEDFAAVDRGRNDRFTITYAGVFYYSVGSDFAKQAGDDVMRTYSPLYFFDGLAELFARRPELKDRVRVTFMGKLGHGYDPIIAEKGLSGVVERLGYIDYDEHIAVLKRSDALLLVLSRGEKSRGWIPSKFYQYLGSGNPILALVPAGEVRSIIEETRAGVCVEPDDVDAISRAIERLYDAYAAGTAEFARDEAEVGRYERRELTSLLARALDTV